MCKYVQDIFQRGVINLEKNQTPICLIPKVKQPEFLSQFHQIALCKVLIKVVMKILANRLKVLMPKLAGERQTSFVSSQKVMDNIILAQKMTLTKKARKKGGMIFKVDLEKAYDHVAWPFLHEVIMAAGFSSHLTALIMSCISSTSLTVL